MKHENDYRKRAEEEPVPVSSRLLMVPAFLVVCLVVFSVLYGFSNAAKKAATPQRTGTPAPTTKNAVDHPGGIQVLDPTMQQPRHHRRPLPGDPAPLHQS